jgi:hypothetical protein
MRFLRSAASSSSTLLSGTFFRGAYHSCVAQRANEGREVSDMTTSGRAAGDTARRLWQQQQQPDRRCQSRQHVTRESTAYGDRSAKSRATAADCTQRTGKYRAVLQITCSFASVIIVMPNSGEMISTRGTRPLLKPCTPDRTTAVVSRNNRAQSPLLPRERIARAAQYSNNKAAHQPVKRAIRNTLAGPTARGKGNTAGGAVNAEANGGRRGTHLLRPTSSARNR